MPHNPIKILRHVKIPAYTTLRPTPVSQWELKKLNSSVNNRRYNILDTTSNSFPKRGVGTRIGMLTHVEPAKTKMSFERVKPVSIYMALLTPERTAILVIGRRGLTPRFTRGVNLVPRWNRLRAVALIPT